jgi:hypothetical protein
MPLNAIAGSYTTRIVVLQKIAVTPTARALAVTQLAVMKSNKESEVSVGMIRPMTFSHRH